MEDREKEIKEELKWIEELREIAPSSVNGFHLERCISIIDSLRVEIEGLRKERKAFNNSELKISLTHIYQALGPHDEETDAHFGQIEKMFIGLHSEIERLRKERDLAINEISKVSRKLGLQDSRLSYLVAAAKPIVAYYSDGVMATGDFIIINKKDVQALSEAMDRVKEEK